MERKQVIRIVSWVLILVLVVNVYGFATGQFDYKTFWVIIIIAAIIAYWVIPKLTVPK